MTKAKLDKLERELAEKGPYGPRGICLLCEKVVLSPHACPSKKLSKKLMRKQ